MLYLFFFQCRLFSELFERAVNNGLAAYSFQNPGRFLEEAAIYYKTANCLIKLLKQKKSLNTRSLPSDPLSNIGFFFPFFFFNKIIFLL